MKRDDTKKNFTALSGNDLKTVHLHYLSFPCFIAFVTFSEVCGVMRYRSVINALFHFFCSENRNFLKKSQAMSVSRGVEYHESIEYNLLLMDDDMLHHVMLTSPQKDEKEIIKIFNSFKLK